MDSLPGRARARAGRKKKYPVTRHFDTSGISDEVHAYHKMLHRHSVHLEFVRIVLIITGIDI